MMIRLTMITGILLISLNCRAQGPVFDEPAGDEEVSARLAFISNSMEDGKIHANIWYWTWTGIQVGGTALFGILAYTQRNEPGAMENNLVSAGQSLISAVMLVSDPLPAALAPRRLRALPQENDGQRRSKLLGAEDALRQSAKWEQFGRGWFNHVGGFAVGVLGCVLLGEAFEDTTWRDGFISLAITVATNELMIWTQPVKSIRDLDAYQKRYGGESTTIKKTEPQAFLVPGLGSVSVMVVF